MRGVVRCRLIDRGNWVEGVLRLAIMIPTLFCLRFSEGWDYMEEHEE